MKDLSANHFFDFAEFRLDVIDRLLFRKGEIVPLTPKSFDILLQLVCNYGRVLTKAELMQAVWPKSYVEECNLARNISTLRQALGSEGLIETLPRRGYRFAASVHETRSDQSFAPPSAAAKKTELQIQSLAVLPFQPLSGQECDASLGLRLADAVITRLSALGRLTVRPTIVVRPYTVLTCDPIALGAELNVDAVLIGTIQQAGKRIRLTLQLLRIKDGVLIWGEQFDARLTHVFDTEDSLSRQVADAFQLRFQ